MSCISPPAMLVPVQRTFVPCCSLALHCPVVPVYRNIIQVGFSPILWKTLGLTLVYYAKLSNILEKSFLPYIESVTSIRMGHPSASFIILPLFTTIQNWIIIQTRQPYYCRGIIEIRIRWVRVPNVLYQRLICCFMRQSMRQRTFCILL